MRRHESLISLSRDHHHALVLAQSLKRDAPARLTRELPEAPEALIDLVRRRFADELEPHFAVEERELVPRCEAHGEPLASQAARITGDHRDLRSMVERLGSGELADDLDAFGRRLEEHIRYEDRTWFPTLERELGSTALEQLAPSLVPIPESAITGFEQDDDGEWVALLACGHRQHVRHRPPWQERAWVTTERGRREHLGARLPCRACRMPRLPPGVSEYKRTEEYDEHTIPAGLRRSHRLKAETWGEIVVTRGRLLYVLEDEGDLTFALRPGQPGVVAPRRPHHVEPQAGARFYVRFLRAELP